MPTNPLLDAALAYGAEGWPVLPVRWTDAQGRCSCRKPGCQHPGKHPLTPHGLKDATTDPDAIRAWWRCWPSANIAIRTGDGLVVLDVDDPRLADALADDVPLAAATLRGRTPGGGVHVFLQETEARSRSGPQVPGVADLKAEGGYALVPPSSINGRQYEFLDGPAEDLLEVPDARRWAAETLAAFGAEVPAHNTERPAYTALAEPVTEGQRNTVLASLAGSLRRDGHDPATIEAALLGVNAARLAPPLPEAEVQGIAQSVGRYKPQRSANPYIGVCGPADLSEALPVETVADLHEAGQGSVAWLWEGYVAREAITLLSAHPKAGKTTMALFLVRALATASPFPFLGWATSRATVLYLAEGSRSAFLDRLDGAGLTSEHSLVILRQQKVFGQDWPTTAARMAGYCRENPVDLVVVDTVRTWLQIADENDGPAVLAALEPLQALAAEGVAVLLVHHLRKAPGEEGTQASGHHALVGTVDIALELRRCGGDYPNRRAITAYSRFDATPASLVGELQEGQYVVLGDADAVAQEDARAKVLAVLPVAPAEGLRRNDLEATTGLRGKALTGALDALLGEGQVERSGTGKTRDPYLWRKRSAGPQGGYIGPADLPPIGGVAPGSGATLGPEDGMAPAICPHCGGATITLRAAMGFCLRDGCRPPLPGEALRAVRGGAAP